MSNEQSFGQVIKARRRELGLTQDELARRVGCAPVTIRKIEYDDLRPSVQIAERLAMALVIPLEERAAFVRLARAEREAAPTPTPTPTPEEIGLEDLSGRAIRGYALGERIGSGGMGAVYRAVQPLVEREVAVKIILPQYANHPEFIRRFEVEAQLVARLEHPHVVPLYDYWREPSVAFLVMRLLRGGSLRGLIESGPLPIEMAVRMLEQVGSALAAAHRAGVIHRDLKPANILLGEDHNAYLADFGIAKNLGNPNLEDATQVDAIVGPAERVGLTLEPGLAEIITRDVGEQPGTLPLLQYALTELFEKREGRTLTKAAYHAIGGVTGALAKRAEEVFAGLKDAEQSAARQLFLRLVTLGEGTEDTRRRVLRAELLALSAPTLTPSPSLWKGEGGRVPSPQGGEGRGEGGMSAVMDAFGKSRLLSFDRDPVTRGPTVEVAHEALLREWGRLREWLNESRADVRLQRQLAAAALEWQNANRDVSFLLTGAKLEQFEGWAATTNVALTQGERAFLEAGIAERDRSEAEERERQRRELETVRKLAETEKHRADEQAQSANRLRSRNRVILGAGVIALVLAVLAGLFGVQSNQNLGAAQIANTQSAANAADAQAASTQAFDNAATAQAEAQSRATAEANAVQERAEAQHQALLASVRELAGAANLNLDVDPERSILLALQAVTLTDKAGQPPLLEAQDALHRAIQTSRV